MGRLVLVICFLLFFFNDTATTEIYTLSLHDALPISTSSAGDGATTASSRSRTFFISRGDRKSTRLNSSHTVISYAVFCLKKKTILCARAQPQPRSVVSCTAIRAARAHVLFRVCAAQAVRTPQAASPAAAADCCFFYWFGDHRDLHSFPTRRSSDLRQHQIRRHRDPGGPGHRKKRKYQIVDDVDRKSTRLNSSHTVISYAVFCLK